MEASKVIIKPLLTEKSLIDASSGSYQFRVARQASKKEIARAVADLFKVDVVDVKTSTIKGRSKRVFRRREKTTLGPLKKAIVKLAKEQKIDIFEVKG